MLTTEQAKRYLQQYKLQYSAKSEDGYWLFEQYVGVINKDVWAIAQWTKIDGKWEIFHVTDPQTDTIK